MSVALDPARSVTLRASAGTGKTWTLTARILRLLLAGAEPGGILALTFTRKAAAEMRSRVADRLHRLAFADEAQLSAQLHEIGAADDAATRARARTLFETYSYAESPLRASTLHVFCAEVLRRFALEAEVPAGFALVEEEHPLRSQAIESVLRRAHREPEGSLSQALDALASAGVDEGELRGLLHELFEHRAEIWAASEGQEAPLETLCTQLAHALPTRADEDPYAAIEAPAVLARLSILVRMLSDIGPVGSIHGAHLEPALACSGAVRLQQLKSVLFTQESTPRAFRPAQTRYTAPQKETITAHYTAVCAAISESSMALLRATTYHRTRAALTLGLAALDSFAEALRRNHQLGFAELEWQTVRLLRRTGSADWVRYKLDQQLQHVLLDEFQDTNPTQWRLLLPLLEEFAARGDGGRTVFLVGDAKQSIYGFRRGEPALLGIAGHWLTQHLHAATESLDQSRRSAPAIMHFVNSLFAGDAGTAIGFAPHSTAMSDLYGAVELAPLIQPAAKPTSSSDAALRNPITTARETGEDRRAVEEAHWVKDRIVQLIDAGTPVTLRDGSTRAMQFGDVMVLARHRTHIGAIEKALGAAHIPYSSATRSTLLDTAIARDLMALLAALDSPHLDLDLAHTLRSPLFSVSNTDLLWLCDTASTAGQSLFAALATPAAPASLQRAHTLLNRWRVLAQTLPPHDLIDCIASEGDLLRRCRAARPQDTLLAANLAALLQLALDSDHGRYPTLSGFLRDCAERAKGKGPDEAPPPSSEPRVQVMTVHAAKGLEAPVVFLVNTAPTVRGSRGGWQIDWQAADERPRVIVHAGRTGQREDLSANLVAATGAREAREALNLLYVAVTRARQYLFISGFQSGKSPLTDSWHARCTKALLDLLPAVQAHPQLLQYCVGQPAVVSTAAPARSPTVTLDMLDVRLLQALAERGPATPAALPSNAAQLRGQVVHAALQHGSAVPALTGRVLRNRVEQQLGLQLPDALWQSLSAEAETVLRAPALAAFFSSHRKAWNEVPLLIETATGAQINVLDRLVDSGDALWVLDYKTHRHVTAAALLAGAQEQLLRYVGAVQRLYPQRRVRAAVIWTPTAALLELPLP